MRYTNRRLLYFILLERGRLLVVANVPYVCWQCSTFTDKLILWKNLIVVIKS